MDTASRIPFDRESCFPNLFSSGYGKSSDEDFEYNCVAWAAGEENTQEWWDPLALGPGYYWPNGLQRNTEVDTFVKLYELVGGYVACDHVGLEEGFEKIALYSNAQGEFTHAARQKEDGIWTSKLGDWEDIEHRTLSGLSGNAPAYGSVAKILKRPRLAQA